MKPYRFGNVPHLKAFSERSGSDNELDRRRVNERRNRIETDAATNELEPRPCKHDRLESHAIELYLLSYSLL